MKSFPIKLTTQATYHKTLNISRNIFGGLYLGGLIFEGSFGLTDGLHMPKKIHHSVFNQRD